RTACRGPEAYDSHSARRVQRIGVARPELVHQQWIEHAQAELERQRSGSEAEAGVEMPQEVPRARKEYHASKEGGPHDASVGGRAPPPRALRACRTRTAC